MPGETSPPMFTELAATYTPNLVTFTIKIMPGGDNPFSVPPEEIVSELGPCLKYIIARFAGKCSNGTPMMATPMAPSVAKRVVKDAAERKAAGMEKVLKGSAARAMLVLNKDLDLAKDAGDPARIERAEQAVKAGQAHKTLIETEE